MAVTTTLTANELLGKTIIMADGSREVVARFLKVKGVVRTESGKEIPVDTISRRGRGYAAAAPAKTNSAKTEDANMNTVTFEELDGARIMVDGERERVDGFMRRKGIVTTEEGTEIPLAEIRRKGRGFVWEKPSKKTAAQGTKPSSTKPAAAAPKADAVTFDELEGKAVLVDGERLSVVGFLRKAGIVKLEDGSRVEISAVTRKGRGYVAATESDTPATKPSSTKPSSTKPANVREAAEVTGDELEGKAVLVDGVRLNVKSVSKAGTKVKLEDGSILAVANIRRKGRGYVAEVEVSKETPARAKPESKPATTKPEGKRRIPREDVEEEAAPRRAAPTAEVEVIEAFTADHADEIRAIGENAVRAAVGKVFKTQYVTSGVVYDDNVLEFSVTLAVSGLSQAKLAKMIEELHLAHSGAGEAESDDAFSEFDEGEEGEDFDEEGEEEQDEEGEEEQDEEDEDFDEEGEEEQDEEDEDFDEEDDEEQDEEDEDFDEEGEEEQDDTPEDTLAEAIDESVKALMKRFGRHPKFREYVEAFYNSEEVESAFGDEVIPGETKLANGDRVYTVAGLDEDSGKIVLLNNSSKKFNLVTIAAAARMEDA